MIILDIFCYNQLYYKKQLKGRNVYFDSLFEGYVGLPDCSKLRSEIPVYW